MDRQYLSLGSASGHESARSDLLELRIVTAVRQIERDRLWILWPCQQTCSRAEMAALMAPRPGSRFDDGDTLDMIARLRYNL